LKGQNIKQLSSVLGSQLGKGSKKQGTAQRTTEELTAKIENSVNQHGLKKNYFI